MDYNIRAPIKKALPFTVSKIGDENALLAWREEQEKISLKMEERRRKTRDRVVLAISRGIVFDLAEDSHLEKRINYWLNQRSLYEKAALAASESAEIYKQELAIKYTKQSWLERQVTKFTKFFLNFKFN